MIVIEYDHDTVDRNTKQVTTEHHVLHPIGNEYEAKMTMASLRKNKRVSNVKSTTTSCSKRSNCDISNGSKHKVGGVDRALSSQRTAVDAALAAAERATN